jgi:hypothetical protein
MFQLLDVEKKLQERTKLEDVDTMPAPSHPTRRVPTTPVEAMVVLPSPREEAMSRRILRSSDSVNKRVPSSLFAAPTEAVNEKKRKGDTRNTIGGGEEHENNHPAAGHTVPRKRNQSLQGGGEEHENSHPGTRQNAARNRSLQGEPRSKRTSTEPQARNTGRPSTASSRTAIAAAAAANKMATGSRVSRPTAASSNKTRGWVR